MCILTLISKYKLIVLSVEDATSKAMTDFNSMYSSNSVKSIHPIQKGDAIRSFFLHNDLHLIFQQSDSKHILKAE